MKPPAPKEAEGVRGRLLATKRKFVDMKRRE
jgi:hypothetical protein